LTGCGKKPSDDKGGLASGTTEPGGPVIKQQQDHKESATSLPAAVVAAWTQAGAEEGWTRWHGFVDFQAAAQGRKSEESDLLFPNWEVPAFEFLRWTDGVVSKLPQPECPFGLSLFRTELSDAGVGDLRG